MPDHRVTAEHHERIFGPPTVTGARPGRRTAFVCRFCGDIHTRGAEPDNCKPEARTAPTLAAPMVAPPFEAFQAHHSDDPAVIGSRHDKREYMARNGLVEYDAGVADQRTPEWIEDRAHEAEIVADLKRFHETDPLNLSPDLKALRMDEAGSLDTGTEIDATSIEVVK